MGRSKYVREDQLQLQLLGLWRVSEALEKEEPLGLTLLDLSKAFDIVSHAILQEKLKNYGVGGVVLSTLKSYLKNGIQVVVMGVPRPVSCLSTKVPYLSHFSFFCLSTTLVA